MNNKLIAAGGKFSAEKLLVGVLVLGGLGWWLFLAKPAGYCKAEARVLTSAEICEKVLRHPVEDGLVRLTAGDQTARDFLAREKRACHVDTTAMTRFRRYGLVDALFSNTITVSTHYAMTEKAKFLRRTQGDAIWSDLMDVSPCGEVRESSGVNY